MLYHGSDEMYSMGGVKPGIKRIDGRRPRKKVGKKVKVLTDQRIINW